MNITMDSAVESSLIFEKKRNYGIDLLRIVSMFFVVCLHILGHKNILENLTSGTWLYYVLWFLYTLAYPAVNCYALISGYVGYTSHHKYSSIINLHFQVLFYTFLGLIMGYVVSPADVGVSSIVRAIFPVRYDVYWYYTAYFCLFFFMPFINKMIDSLSKASSTKLVVSIVVICSVVPTVYMRDIIGTSGGYSFVWLTMLYVIGAYVRKYRVFDKTNNYKLFGFFAVSMLLTWSSKLVIELLTEKIFGTAKFQDVLYNYTSPTILLMAVMLLAIFSKMELRVNLQKVIGFVAPLAFGVYLLHESPLIRDNFVSGKFAYYLNFNPVVALLAVIGTIMAVFVIGLAVEYLRQKIFALIKVKKFSIWIEGLIFSVYKRFFSR